MVNSMVERATSSMLIGPDWAMNTEICDICNHDPAQAKDVVKGIKRRLGSKNPKVQLLALTLLETIVKNCGDFVHMHVAERDLLHEMVKIVKKKPDFHVKEKILILIDTWQEAFGGARARYPQYYAAYHELLRLGAVFPQKTDRPAPVLTNPQTQSRSSSYPENGNEAAESSAEAEFPTLSLTELQNARGIMDVLAEMLTAIDPEKKEGLRQEVVVDLVEQCRAYKQRVVHLVNSTSDESLLCQGLALNDDLQRCLAKHEALISGSSEKSKPETSQALVPVDAPLIDTGDNKQPGPVSGTGVGASSGLEAELLAITPITTNGASEKVNPKFDLLSGDDFGENSLAIVPTGEPLVSSAPQQNALAIVDMFSQNNNGLPAGEMLSENNNGMPTGQTYSNYPNANNQYDQQTPFNQGSTSSSSWNGHVPQQDQPLPAYVTVTGGPTSDGLPPPPWEAQTADDNQSGGPQPLQSKDQMYMAPPNNHLPSLNTYPQQFQGMNGMIQQQQQFQAGPVPSMYTQPMPQPYGYGGGGYAYGFGQQQQNAQFLDQRMSGLSVRDDGYLSNTVYTGPSMANASYVHVPSGKPMKAQDKLFGDLVDFAKVKPNKTNPATAGTM